MELNELWRFARREPPLVVPQYLRVQLMKGSIASRGIPAWLSFRSQQQAPPLGFSNDWDGKTERPLRTYVALREFMLLLLGDRYP